MKKKKLIIILPSAFLLILLIWLFFSLPTLVDRKTNSLVPMATQDRKIQVPDLHRTLFVSDLHADTLLWNRSLLQEGRWGHVDLPRLQKGGMALQAFSVVTETPLVPNIVENSDGGIGVALLTLAQRWPPKTWMSLSGKAIYQAEKLQEAVRNSDGQLRLILTHNDLMRLREDRQKDPKIVGAWLTIEGGQALEGDLLNLDQLYNKGFRMVAPTHMSDTNLGGSQSGKKKTGLTELGRLWLQKMEEKKMIVDLAHASEATFDEVIKLAKRPPLVSHTGVKAVCSIPRNLSDQQIIRIAAKGGLIGVGLWEDVLCGQDLSLVVQSISHICKLVGCQHVALGSDWDGTVKTTVDSSHIGWLTYELAKAGFSEADIRGVMGENTFQFLLENLP